MPRRFSDSRLAGIPREGVGDLEGVEWPLSGSPEPVGQLCANFGQTERKLVCIISSRPVRIASRIITISCAILGIGWQPASAQVNVLTYHNDAARTGVNTNET